MVDNSSAPIDNDEVAKLVENSEGQEQKQCEWQVPVAQGLYDPQNEHEACGVGFIVAIDGKPSHKVCFFYYCLFMCVCK